MGPPSAGTTVEIPVRHFDTARDPGEQVVMDGASALQLRDPCVSASDGPGLAPLAKAADRRGDVLSSPVVDANVGQRDEPADRRHTPKLGQLMEMARGPDRTLEALDAPLGNGRCPEGH